ncbi:hypothetical protein ACQ86D_51810 (plasmid) [Streptomyces galilaeus]
MNNDLREMLIPLASGAVLAFFGAALSDWQALRTEAASNGLTTRQSCKRRRMS